LVIQFQNRDLLSDTNNKENDKMQCIYVIIPRYLYNNSHKFIVAIPVRAADGKGFLNRV